MNTTDLVARFEGVRQTGHGRWIACCPAHGDKRASLSVRELEDGRTLLHCFAGCHVDSVLSAVGLTASDLFPPRDCVRHDRRQLGRGLHPMDVLACVVYECTVVLVAVNDMLDGRVPSEADQTRLLVAARRISAAIEVAHG